MLKLTPILLAMLVGLAMWFFSSWRLRRELDRIRRAGFAVDREEHEPGIICVAVPILTGAGRVLGALSVTGTTARTSLAAMERLVPDVACAAARIAEEAEAWRFPEQGPQRLEQQAGRA
jgi:hypothetical protein